MLITFDPDKDAINQSKHGISLVQAHNMEWDYLISKVDDSMDYGEIRMKGFVPIGQKLYCVIYTDRAGDERRIISLRTADNRERRDYVRFFSAS